MEDVANAQNRKKTQSPQITIEDLQKPHSSTRARGKLRQSTDAARFQDNVQESQGRPSGSTGEQRRWDHMQQPPRNPLSLHYELHM